MSNAPGVRFIMQVFDWGLSPAYMIAGPSEDGLRKRRHAVRVGEDTIVGEQTIKQAMQDCKDWLVEYGEQHFDELEVREAAKRDFPQFLEKEDGVSLLHKEISEDHEGSISIGQLFNRTTSAKEESDE